MLFLPFLPRQHRQKADTVQSLNRSLNIGRKYVTKRRHHVPKGTHKISLRTRLHMPRPRNNQRNADAAFIKVALIPPIDTVAVKEIRVSTSLLMRTIIAGKDDDSIVIQTFFFQLLHQLPHVNVQAGHHRCKSSMRIKLSTIASFAESRMTGFSTLESFLRILTAELTDNAVLGHNQFCMRQDGRIPQKERFIRRGIVQVFQGFLVNKIRSIRSTSVLYLKDIVLQVDTLTVVPQMVRIIAMRQKLAIKTEESIAALCLRITRGSDKA